MNVSYQALLCVLVLRCSYLVVYGFPAKVPSGACTLKNRTISQLSCYPDVQLTLTNDSYVPENAHCKVNSGGYCLTCDEGILVETECDKPHSRRKRATVTGILSRILRKIPPHKLKKILEIVRRFISNPSINCGIPRRPDNAWSVTCTQTYRAKSTCVPNCRSGYKPAERALAVCDENGKWVESYWACEDVKGLQLWTTTDSDGGSSGVQYSSIPPVFTNCPTDIINTINRRFTWSVALADSSNQITLKQMQGRPPGSLLEYGTHLIKYSATDSSGNVAYCSFAIEVKRSDCPRPKAEDSDLQFKCNGLKYRSVCHLTCKSGTIVEGSSKYIACAEDTTEDNISYWQPVNGQMATCYKRKCSALRSPKNGAIVCDKQFGGTVCQLMCNEDFDVPEGQGTVATFICSKSSDRWIPHDKVPDCEAILFPDEYFLPTEFHYYYGDCSDPKVMDRIKQQFIDNLKKSQISPCMTDVCSLDDIQVDCGQADDLFRKKRSIGMLKIRVVFSVKNKERTLSPAVAIGILRDLANKSQEVVVASMMSASDSFGMSYLQKSYSNIEGDRVEAFLEENVGPVVTSVIGDLMVKCKEGFVQSKSGNCVPCSVGTYAVNKTCIRCPLNTYQNVTASTSCESCPEQHYTPVEGAFTCAELCGNDTFSPSGAPPCFPCPIGQHQPQYGSTTCVPCTNETVSISCGTDPNVTVSSSLFQVSDFLLACDSESCYSF